MNPSLPWDDWYDKLVQHDLYSAAGEQMAKEEHSTLSLTSFEARILSETDEECDEHWTAMKQEWSSLEGLQHPKQLSLSHIFYSVDRGGILQTN
eukprot:2805453-Rhodomonas_salina.1